MKSLSFIAELTFAPLPGASEIYLIDDKYGPLQDHELPDIIQSLD